MSNRYIHAIHSDRGSANWRNFVDGLVDNASDGQISSTGDLVAKVKSNTKEQSARMKRVSELSEVNMELLEENLVLMDKTLRIYNVAGVLAGVSAFFGSILLGIKLKKHYDRKTRRF